MKCKWCNNEAAYKKKELCHSHYNKMKNRLEKAIPIKDLNSDYRKIKIRYCKKCGKDRQPGITNVLCHECLLAYIKLSNNRKKEKKSKYWKKYYIDNKPAIKKYKMDWWKKKNEQSKHNERSQSNDYEL